MRTRTQAKRWVGVEELESRTLLSGWNISFNPGLFPPGGGAAVGGGGLNANFHFGRGINVGGVKVPGWATSDPTIQADIAQLRLDLAQLKADYIAAEPQLRADRDAIRAAYEALKPQLQPIQDQLKSDIRAGMKALFADLKLMRQNRNDPVALAAARAQFDADKAALQATITAGKAAIQAIIDNDAALVAAKAQLEADSAAIRATEALVKADIQKLKDDLAALV